jgi:hypothetical protein
MEALLKAHTVKSVLSQGIGIRIRYKFCVYVNLSMRISDLTGNEKKVHQNFFDLNIMSKRYTKNSLPSANIHKVLI